MIKLLCFAAGFLLSIILRNLLIPEVGKFQVDESHVEKNYYRFVWDSDPDTVTKYKKVILKIEKRNDLASDVAQ